LSENSVRHGSGTERKTRRKEKDRFKANDVGLMNIDDVKKVLMADMIPKTLKKSDLLSTSSTLLNLALSGKKEGGWAKGRYFFFVGDSSSGKTFLTLSCLAEAAANKEFDDYRLIHNDVEGGALMNVKKFFGQKLAERIETHHSETVEQFYDGIFNLHQEGRPFVLILDSQDALQSEYEKKKTEEARDAREKGRKAKGDYGDGKAKIHSRRLREVVSDLEKSGSILIIINQTRDNIDAGLFEPPTTYSGGRALRFYATAQVWSSTRSRLKKIVRNKDRQIGIMSKVEVKKNRLTGKEWKVDVPIYHSYGVDDIGSCVDFLVVEGHWKKAASGVITAKDFVGFSGYKDNLIRQLQEEGLENEIREITEDVWKNIEAACIIDRKPRYE
jgi:RecA/RadA recombinase